MLIVVATLAAVTADSAVMSQPAQKTTLAEAVPQITPDGYTSARVCGECHTDIHSTWKNSLHAFAITDPLFDRYSCAPMLLDQKRTRVELGRAERRVY